VPVGFIADPVLATMAIRTAGGVELRTDTVDTLTGRMLWPGAAVDSEGVATDWPGWTLADDGVTWVTDPSDAFLRDGLSIEVTVNPTANATVSYPEATAACAGPPTDVPPTTPPSVTAPTTTVPASPTSAVSPTTSPASAVSTSTADLPATGSSGLGTMLAMGLGLIVLGGVARRIRRV
jgi:LPXTG-motif cell wall-anchored protein